MKNRLILLFGAILCLGFVSCSGSQKADKSKKGWTLVWEDDFDKSELNDAIWSKIPAGEKSLDRYMSDNNSLYVFQDGKLVLRGFRKGDVEANTFITSGITTQGKKKITNGRLEVRAKLNASPGTVSYITLKLADQDEYTAVGVMDRYGVDKYIYQSVSSSYTKLDGMADNPPSSFLVGIDPIDYHTYSVEFYKDSVVFFVDEMRTKKYPRILTDMQGQFPFYDKDFSLFLGVGIQSSFDVTEKPVDLFVDWVRFYEPEKTK